MEIRGHVHRHAGRGSPDRQKGGSSQHRVTLIIRTEIDTSRVLRARLCELPFPRTTLQLGQTQTPDSAWGRFRDGAKRVWLRAGGWRRTFGRLRFLGHPLYFVCACFTK